MTSKVGICNMALSAIGEDYLIADIGEQTKQARVCRVWYDTALGSVLQDFPWNFATKFIAMAATDEVVPGWSNTYAYPSDCLFAKAVTDASGARLGGHYRWTGAWCSDLPQIMKVPYTITAGAQQSLICTDLPSAYLMYIALIENTERYPPMFVESLALRIASSIAMPLSTSAEVLARISAAYQQRVVDAKVSVMNEAQQDPESITPSLGARW